LNDHVRLREIQTFEQLDEFEQVVEQAEFLCTWRQPQYIDDPAPDSKYYPIVVPGAEAFGTFKYSLWILSKIIYQLMLDNGLPTSDEYLFSNTNIRGFTHLHKSLRNLTYIELQHLYGTFMFIRSLLFRRLPCYLYRSNSFCGHYPSQFHSVFYKCDMEHDDCPQCYQGNCFHLHHTLIDRIIQRGFEHVIGILCLDELDIIRNKRLTGRSTSGDYVKIPLFEQLDLELDRRGIIPHPTCGPKPKKGACDQPGPVKSIFAAELKDGKTCELWRFGPGVKGLFRNSIYEQKEARRRSQKSEKNACIALGDILTGRTPYL
jgi:hypothetical protein